MKKILNLFLLCFVLITFYGCSNRSYEVSIIIETQTINVNESINYQVKVEDTFITDFKINCSKDNIINITTNEIEGLNEGECNVVISFTYKKKELTKEFLITVINLDLEVELNLNKELKVNEVTNIQIYVKDIKINDFLIFISDSSILKQVDSSLKALKPGKTLVTFTFTYNNKDFNETVEVTVFEEKVIKTNIKDTYFVNEKFKVIVYLDEIEITEFTLKSNNIDILDINSKTKEVDIFEKGEFVLTITFSYENSDYTYQKEVKVDTSLSLRIEYDTLYLNNQTSLTVYLMPFDTVITDYTFTISNKQAIKIENGFVTGLIEGESLVSFQTIYEGITIYYTHKFKTSIYVEKELIINLDNYMFLNQTKDVKVGLNTSSALLTDFQITSSDESIIKVNGLSITGLKVGKSLIKVSKEVDGVTLEKEIEIEVFLIDGIKVNIKTDSYLNEVVFYEVLSLPDLKKINDFEITSNKEYLLVNELAYFSKEIGNATLTIKYSEFCENINLLVSEKVFLPERVSISGATGILENTTLKITIKVYPSVATYVLEVGSLDEDIVTLSDELILKGVSVGVCKIYAKVSEDVYTSCLINVIAKTEESEFYGAGYYQSSIKNYNELINGITQTTYLGYSKSPVTGIDADGYGGLSEIIDNSTYYPQQVNVLSIPSSTDIKIIPWANLSNHKWTLNSVKALIEDYEAKNPGKKVVCAVNGDFFDISGNGNLPYQTVGSNVSDGEFYKTTSNSVVGFTNNGTTNTLVSESSPKLSTYMVLSVYDEDGNIIKKFDVQNLNKYPLSFETSVYFGVYNSNHEYVSKTVENSILYIVDNAELALPNSEKDFYGKGSIGLIKDSYTLNVGQFAIQTNNLELREYLSLNTTIRVQYEYVDSLSEVTSATGYAGVVLDENLTTFTDSNLLSRAPRTVVGVKEDGTIIMLVVDGRQGSNNMYGACGYELASMMSSLGCVRAYNLDGGGSSTMVIQSEYGLQVMNSPSDGKERNDANCILVVVDDPSYQVEVIDKTSTSIKLNVNSLNLDYQNYTPVIYFEGDYYEAINNVIELNNLASNSTYGYQIYYKDEEDNLFKTLQTGNITTLQDDFYFLGITLTEDSEYYNFEVYYHDVDESSNIKSMILHMDKLNTYFENGKLKIKKDLIDLDKITFSYWYIDSKKTLTITSNEYFHIK